VEKPSNGSSDRNLKCAFEGMLPCYCDATKASSRTIRSRVSQPGFVAEGADFMTALKTKERISWLQWTAFHDCIVREQWTDSCAMWLSHWQTNCHCKN